MILNSNSTLPPGDPSFETMGHGWRWASLAMNTGWHTFFLLRPCTHRRAREGRQVVIHVFNVNDAGRGRLQAKMLAIHVLHFYFQLVFIK